ncbi:hypothetical protein FG87_13050 [Nocardia vulneris]|uniref:DUF3298 domain-containing protein n=2 Tax=Nocardia vulneris TaxID=1141657 RepID=A0ABR4ZGN0_9NOCA|nr:hypothetical protein FG87_13050 [Nocardia vulneris]
MVRSMTRYGVALGATLIVALGACGTEGASDGASSSSPQTPQQATSASAPPTTGTAPPTRDADPAEVTSGGSTYTVRRVEVPNGVGTTDQAASLELSGGDARVTEVFNRGVRTYVKEQVDLVNGGDDQRQRAVSTSGEIFSTESTVSEVVSGLIVFKDAAHPTKILGTITTDSRTARPVLIGDLFTDPATGLAELARATTEATRAVYPELADSKTITDALQPTERNYANWVPTPTGVQIHIATGVYVYGYPCVQVPWSRLRPVLGPALRAVAEQAPDSAPATCGLH